MLQIASAQDSLISHAFLGIEIGAFGSGTNMSEVTQILEAIQQGNPQAAEKLLPFVYEAIGPSISHQGWAA